MNRKRQGVLFDVSPSDISVYERRLAEKGVRYVAGVDEVGRGCLAGPVLAAAVILPYPCAIAGIKDSKKLRAETREELYHVIKREAVSFGIGIVPPDVIDDINILKATLKAMRLAIEALTPQPEYVLVDGSQVVPVKIPQLIVPKGDSRSISVAAASILAKVERDRLMVAMEEKYPAFSFSVHKGYGTSLHLSEIKKNGHTDIHRRTFRGVMI